MVQVRMQLPGTISPSRVLACRASGAGARDQKACLLQGSPDALLLRDSVGGGDTGSAAVLVGGAGAPPGVEDCLIF